jgi:hypothetical protein
MLKLETQDRLDPDELENIMYELDYSFESEYGPVITTIDEWDTIAINRAV